MAKTPPAAADAPVLDDPVEVPGDVGEARPRWWRRLPRLSVRLSRPVLSKKAIVLALGGVVGVTGAGAAAFAFWPAAPDVPVARKTKPKRVKPAASAPALAQAVSAASQPERARIAKAAASGPGTAASGAEDPIDRLQRRLAETLGSGGTLQADAPGELRLTARRVSEPAPDPRPAARAGKPSAIAWSYDGAGGPDAWGRLRPEFARCASGSRQSPIDLRDGIQVRLDPVQFDYRPGRFSVIDNGHTVQVNVAPGNVIEVMGRRFELQHFQFHRPSEVRIEGRQFDMDVHLVHRDADGKLAVVAIVLERGAAQPAVQSVWNNLPLEKGEEQAAQGALDPAQLLPADRGYFTYMGSLTAPPCSEGVLWMVMKKPVPVSEQQVGIFSRLYPMNARPVQSLAGRMIKESGAP